MKKIRIILPIILYLFGMFFLNSCNWFSRDKTAATELKSGDTIQIRIDELSKKIEKRSSNYKLYFDRAKLYEASDKMNALNWEQSG